MILETLRQAHRPVLAYGWGVRLAGAEREAQELAHALGIPVVVTWGGRDLFPAADALCLGAWGTHGGRAANFAVQNCDWLLTVGTRLDTKATGNLQTFAPQARKFMVDIDVAEIDKFQKLGMEVSGIVSDAKEFLGTLLKEARGVTPDFLHWQLVCSQWATRYAPDKTALQRIDPYQYVAELSSLIAPDDVIVSDTGCALAWMMQAFKFSGQRFIHAFNNTPMGYGLPAAIGAAFTGKRVILITGDGGLSVNIGELATLAKHCLPVKILLFNNQGHAMCRQTQRQWLGGEYPATSHEGGLANPDFHQIAESFGIPTTKTPWADAARRMTEQMLAIASPALVELEIDPDSEVVPQVRFGGSLEDGDPQLPAEELERVRAEALACDIPLGWAA